MATKKKTKKKVKRWMQGAVKHKGSLTRAAEKKGVSTKVEAESEAKSPDKHIASRGRLALRFMGKAKHGNIKKAKGKKKVHRKRIASKA